MTLPGLDRWLTTQPESAGDAPDEDRGCADCGDTPCTCDERCGGCMRRFQSEAEADRGLCGPCAQDAAEAGYDGCGGETA